MAKDDEKYQSRPMSAYEGAALKAWGPSRGGAPGPQPTPAVAKDWASGRTDDWYADGGPVNPEASVEGSLMSMQEGAAKGYVNRPGAEILWAESTGGDVAGKPSPIPKIEKGIKYSANVPVQGAPGKTAPLFLTSAKPDEVESLVAKGVISRATADKIMAKRNEGDPMQKMRAKTAPAPGMDWAPSASSLPPETFAPAPVSSTSPVLPAAPKPATGDEYASVLQWSRGKWGL